MNPDLALQWPSVPARYVEPLPVWVDPEGRRVRMYADHVLIVLKPLDEVTEAGVVMVRERKTVINEPRVARVLAVGPGHYIGCRHCSHVKTFVPTTVKAGETVLVPNLAGADWSLDRLPPRHMPNGVEWGITEETSRNFGESQLIGDLRLSTLRIVKEAEILAVLEREPGDPIPGSKLLTEEDARADLEGRPRPG